MNDVHDHATEDQNVQDHDHHSHASEAPRFQMPEVSPDQMKAVGDFFQNAFSKKGLRLMAVGLVTATTIGTVMFAMVHKDNAQLQTVAKNKKDVNWLVNPQPDFGLAYEQFSLYISNDDATRGSPGILDDDLVLEAYRLRSLAFSTQNDSKSNCYRKDISECYRAMALQLSSEYETKPGASARLYISIETKALVLAQHGNLPPVPEDNSAIYKRVVQRFIQDSDLARRNTLGGQIKQQNQVELDMRNGVSPGGQ